MQIRCETVPISGIRNRYCLVHLSDIHFSRITSHEQNEELTADILRKCGRFDKIDAFCITGDLVSRKWNAATIPDAVQLVRLLRKHAPVLYSFGNHEMDLPVQQRRAFVKGILDAGATVLHNRTIRFRELHVTGLTLPRHVFQNSNGSYTNLSTVTLEMVENCLGACEKKPAVLLAHSPLGLPAYGQWGADLVLSGHIHGGIVRIKEQGILSPERLFYPKYTKGMYLDEATGARMELSAGIGKLRINNPAEIVCVELVPETR